MSPGTQAIRSSRAVVTVEDASCLDLGAPRGLTTMSARGGPHQRADGEGDQGALPPPGTGFVVGCLVLILSLSTSSHASAQEPGWLPKLTIHVAPPQPTERPVVLHIATTIEVIVPEEAELWFQSTRTKQAGNRRVFTTPPLPVGETFTYDVYARWIESGVERTVRETLIVRGGERLVVDLHAREAKLAAGQMRVDQFVAGQAVVLRPVAFMSVTDIPPGMGGPPGAAGGVIAAAHETAASRTAPGNFMVIREYPPLGRGGVAPAGVVSVPHMSVTEMDVTRAPR